MTEKDFIVSGYLFGSKLLPSDIYEARTMEVSGKTYVYPALCESSGLLVPDRERSLPNEPYYTLPVYNNNGKRWMPCATGGSSQGDTSYIEYINSIDACILEQMLRMNPQERENTGYAISHWVFEVTDEGLSPIEGSLKSTRVQCCITGYQSATWTIAHKANGSTKGNGERVSYAATGFLPIDQSEPTMHSYHKLGYYLIHAIGKYTSTNPTAKGIEIEGVFFEEIGANDKRYVNADLSDKLEYEGVYLNRRGIMATILLKLYRFQPIITGDCTVDFEFLTKPLTSLTALKDELCALNKLLDIKSYRCGTHIHISPIDCNVENLFEDYSPRYDILPVAQELFKELIKEFQNNPSATFDIFGRTPGDWCMAGIGYGNHNVALNMTPYHTVEWRLSKYQNELQYLRLINMVCEMTMELYAVLSQSKTMEAAQKKISQIWEKTKRHETRTDKNASKIPNESGTRHRNER